MAARACSDGSQAGTASSDLGVNDCSIKHAYSIYAGFMLNENAGDPEYDSKHPEEIGDGDGDFEGSI